MGRGIKGDAVSEPREVNGRLACGCRVAFRAGVEGSPVAVIIAVKASGCGTAIHVAGMPVYDHREALRPSTRFVPHAHSDYDEN